MTKSYPTKVKAVDGYYCILNRETSMYERLTYGTLSIQELKYLKEKNPLLNLSIIENFEIPVDSPWGIELFYYWTKERDYAYIISKRTIKKRNNLLEKFI